MTTTKVFHQLCASVRIKDLANELDVSSSYLLHATKKLGIERFRIVPDTTTSLYVSSSDVPRIKEFVDTNASLYSRPSFLRKTTIEKLLFQVNKIPGGCWIWNGRVNNFGYGVMSVNGKETYVHRICYKNLSGPIPEGLYIDHLCRTPRCVNPEHLEPVTPKVNQHRGFSITGINSRKTHCIHGHPFDETNTYIRPDHGTRCCRACMKIREQKSA